MISFNFGRAGIIRVFFMMLTLAVAANVYAQFAGGNGTEDSPWQVATATHLNNVRDYLGQQHSDKYFIQTANIDLGEAPWNEGQGWLPIGFHLAWNNFGYFYGNYDGNGFSIANLTIDRNTDYQGLFGYIEQGTVHNVALDSVNVRGRQYVGALAGRNSGAITNSYATGTLTGTANCNYIGGLVGYNYIGIVMNCWANVTVSGEGSNMGGLVGQNTLVSIIAESYSAGSVTGNSNIGGLVGQNRSIISNSYSIGTVSGEERAGGLVGTQDQANVTNSYWNIETSEQENSAGGQGRTTAQMVLPDNYEEWNFERVWTIIPGLTYPYLAIQQEPLDHNFPYGRVRPYPLPACTPTPADDTTGVSINLEEVSWAYNPHVLYSNPCGFRVYMNTTGEFGEEDEYEWVAYDEEENLFSCSDIIPEQLDYLTKYYWLVIPTVIDPDQEIYYDAEECSVWSFTTEINPNPVSAVNPVPADDTTGVSIELHSLGWDYIVDTLHVNPAGFRVYLNTDGDFGEDDEYDWVPYNEGQVTYASTDLLFGELLYATKYYWTVIPTTIEPERRGSDRERERREWRKSLCTTDRRAVIRNVRAVRCTAESRSRGDAEDCPVWTFTTEEPHPNPLPAKNPSPVNEAVDIPVSIDTLFWDYIPDPAYINPAGFRVYLNTTGEFGEDDEFDWVSYSEDSKRFFSTALLAEGVEYDTEYYWQVIPTTIKPESRGSDGERERRAWSNSLCTTDRRAVIRNVRAVSCTAEGRSRGDAEDCPVWTFRTEVDTHVEDIAGIRETKLNRNYPNPFNPETTIGFYLSEPSKVSLEIFNNRGQIILTIIDNDYLKEGDHSYLWNGRDKFGQQLSSGVYFYRLESRNDSGRTYSFISKMIMLK